MHDDNDNSTGEKYARADGGRKRCCGNCAFYRQPSGTNHGIGHCPFSTIYKLYQSHPACINYEYSDRNGYRVCSLCGADISHRRGNATYCETCAENMKRGISAGSGDFRQKKAPKKKTDEQKNKITLLPGLTGAQIEAIARKYGMHYGTFTAAIRAGNIKVESIQKDIDQMLKRNKKSTKR